MRILILYPYPLEPDGQSMQGHYLAKGLRELSVEVFECNREDNLEKLYNFKSVKPDFVIGIGYWGNTPELIRSPLNHNLKPIPWFNADGWVANYHNILENLPLIVSTSNWVKQTYIRDGLTGKNIEPCGIGFDPSIFYPLPRQDESVKKLREMLGILDHEMMIFTAGGDVTSKGAQEMFKALAKINDKFPNWKYVLKTYESFSAEDHGTEEHKLIEELGLDEGRIIYLTGAYSPEFMSALINACDIYAAPSRLEGFGMIQLEAQACGKPVISINVGGPKDIILHEKTGYLVDVEHEIKLESEWVYEHMGFDKKKRIHFPIPKTFAYKANTDQLADCLLKLFNDVKLRHKMGEEAAKHALEKFHYKFIAAKINKIIDENIN